jgi:hypothetical protein
VTSRTAPWKAFRPVSARAGAAAVLLATGLAVAGCSGTEGSTQSTGAASTQTGATSATPTETAAVPPSAADTATAASDGASANTSATVGALIPNFPSTLIPPLEGAQVISSSLDTSKPVAVASLVQSTSSPAADVVNHYTTVFQDQGFTALPGDAVGSVASKDFSRAEGKETINLSVVPSGGTVTVTIGANVLPASLK